MLKWGMKVKWWVLGGLLVLVVAVFYWKRIPGTGMMTPEATQAIIKAKAAYNEFLNRGMDFKNGPCIADNLMPDWVADIAHEPRQAVDDQPENQCLRYREGQAHHFVELTPSGEFIRAN